ncbi:addiction module toxin, RelE/StbE family [Methylocaldum marinum]|uniref:Addiction module toxin, RelE/StbE family n=1 Tax=Methylocaldum marinum TaxID=1432792 RepID=A0A250KR06_9GAMM|nr:type II toxin-antitoxin system RelE/ParE family toxin [Methylocaldum marinum]BBA34048.1 addiction module toxin, RelE/StbE family [Methylocaldum marinum]
MKIVWARPARQDLRDIYLYIAQDNPYAARKLQSEIRQRVALLQDNPGFGRTDRVTGTRELVMGDSPYILPYRVRQDCIEILAVYHGARKWPEEFRE